MQKETYPSLLPGSHAGQMSQDGKHASISTAFSSSMTAMSSLLGPSAKLSLLGTNRATDSMPKAPQSRDNCPVIAFKSSCLEHPLMTQDSATVLSMNIRDRPLYTAPKVSNPTAAAHSSKAAICVLRLRKWRRIEAGALARVNCTRLSGKQATAPMRPLPSASV